MEAVKDHSQCGSGNTGEHKRYAGPNQWCLGAARRLDFLGRQKAPGGICVEEGQAQKEADLCVHRVTVYVFRIG